MIRKMTAADKGKVLDMMRSFYDSPAVIHTASNEVLERNIDACTGDEPLIEGFVFDVDGVIAGYCMAAKNFTTEYGGLCIWIEDLYLLPEYRGKGLAAELFKFLEAYYPAAVRFKLEVEPENENAVKAYRKSGYKGLGYSIMDKVMIEDFQ